MAGWDLTHGSLSSEVADDQSLWHLFHRLFSTKSRNQSSYKFAFLRSILENLYNVDNEFCLSYDMLFDNFARIYWNLVVLRGLKQSHKGQKASIENVLREQKVRFNIPDQIGYDSLDEDVKVLILKTATKTGKRYVIGALYADTYGLFYEFDLKREIFRLNPVAHKFMQRHQTILMKANNYEFAKFIQNVNQDIFFTNLITVLENVTYRDVLKEQRGALTQLGAFECFYCNVLFTENTKIHVDHFIPWSFIYNNQVWNLVLACNKCNISKSDKLSHQKYLRKIIDRNDSLKGVISGFNTTSTLMNDLYSYAVINGFQPGWEPRK